MTLAAVLFWLSFAGLLATYVAFPVLMALIGRLGRTQQAGELSDPPSVTVVIAAKDESPVIAAKVQSCLDQAYPADRLRVLVASDGSTDETAVEARRFDDGRVSVLELQSSNGKATALNAAMAHVQDEVVVLTDARQILHPEATRRLVMRLEDPEVGAVSGDLRYDRGDESGMRRALHRYWDYETGIRLGESRIHSCVGATGALYAIRRELWEDLPPDTLLDDVYTPMRIVLTGRRVVFEPRAWALDTASTGDDREYSRRVRTLTGNYQLLLSLPAVLNPLRNPIWLQFVFHKLGRLFSPLMLLGLMIGAMLARGIVYDVAFWLQAAFWTFAFSTYASRSKLRFAPLLALPYAFAVTQGAALRAFLHFLRRDWNVWSKNT